MTTIFDLSLANREPNQANRLHLLTTQKTIWVPQFGPTVYVNLMPIRYVKNLRRWLAERAWQLKEDYTWNFAFGGPYPSGDAAQDAFESAMIELDRLTPRQWLREQPLYRQLLIREWRARNDS